MDEHFDPVVLQAGQHSEEGPAGLHRRRHLLGLSLRHGRADEHAGAHRPYRSVVGRPLPLGRLSGREEAHGQASWRRASSPSRTSSASASGTRRSACASVGDMMPTFQFHGCVAALRGGGTGLFLQREHAGDQDLRRGVRARRRGSACKLRPYRKRARRRRVGRLRRAGAWRSLLQ